MSLETAAFFRFYYLAASNNNKLYEKFEFVIKDRKHLFISFLTRFSHAEISILHAFLFVFSSRKYSTGLNSIVVKC